jgi:5,10-methylenetetrahydromethanopterin reductase
VNNQAPRQRHEFWRVSHGRLKVLGRQARQFEDQGWDGMTVGDSQCIGPETYVMMTLAMTATSTLKLCTWVTNPFTRHPAVAGAALATLQVESDGRIQVGIGRGDSALAFLGLSPAPVEYFGNYVQRLRGYLRGDEVPMQIALDSHGLLADADALELADRPKSSTLKWLPADYAPVPVIIVASGPRVMALGARIADGVSAVVGADPVRLTWARDEIRAGCAAAGRPADDLTLGLSCMIAVNDDADLAREIARPLTAVHARFSIMHNKFYGPATPQVRAGLQTVHDTYDMNLHAQAGAQQSSAIPDEVVNAYAVYGPPSYCAERILEWASLGYTRISLSVESPDADPELLAKSHRLIAERVLPEVRRHLPS